MTRIASQAPTQKEQPLRDRSYLDFLKTQPCVVTGQGRTDFDAIDPAHIGTRGRGVKSPDDEALPILHSLHQAAHNSGEITELTTRALASSYGRAFLRACFRAYARELYREWKGEA